MDREILGHLIDIKERIASVEAKQDQVTSIVEKVSEIEKDLVKVKTSIKIFQWTAGIMVAMFAAVVKVWSKN